MKISHVLLGLLLLGGATFFVAKQRGWLDRAAPTASALCRHELETARCPFCTPSRVEALGECGEHGVPEAFCTRCNAALIPAFEIEGDWCGEHALPESQCLICNPELADTSGFDARLPVDPSEVQVVSDPDLPRRLRTPAVTCDTSALQVRFNSPRIAADIGLEFARVTRREVSETVNCNAEFAFDGNRFAQLASRAPGVVREVAVDLGAQVEAGALLAVVDSPELGSAKAEFLQAQALVSLWERNHEREQALLVQGAGTERESLEAETSLAESRIQRARAEQNLRTLGLDDAAVAQVIASDDSSSLLRLTAPFAGEVVTRQAVAGEVVERGTPLFSVADTSRMWALLEVFDRDLARVRPGQQVLFDVAGLPGDRRGGTLTWVASQLDRHTRTLAARAELPNPHGVLRAGMFAEAQVSVLDHEQALVVPKDAVQWEGCCNVVFVRHSDVLFEPRKVLLGAETERHFVVREGLDGDESVVTTGAFLLKTELLKGSIGAGCCEVEPGN
ncbi:MAG: hypothetical protein DHS20C15_13620 [Planctomycetota bacterium]|nr:MAG: hypothetical protein DHS20C15_13620 [Planctomycetota bacterium]